METPERLENCPSTPELDRPQEEATTSCNIEEARLVQLKRLKGICVICYSSIKEGKRCFPENCLHLFHFDCLQRWSEQKNQCPLCKKVFDQIIHNIKSKTEYERYAVTVLRQQEDSPIDLRDFVSFPVYPLNVPLNSVFHRVDFLPVHSPRRRYTYRTRFEATLEQNERIQELFGSRVENDYARSMPAEWRRFVYDRNLYAIPLPDITGRYRECSSEFYRENPAQTHRLIPWLNRELVVLMPTNQTNHIVKILDDMRDLLCRHDIQSRKIKKYFQRYLHLRTDHFIHEFYHFAISPYDIVGYDRNVDYSPRIQSTSTTVEISSSSDSSDGEVQVIDVETRINEDASNSASTIGNSTTTVVMETHANQEDSCVITDITAPENISNSMSNENQTDQVKESNPVVLESSSDSECEFVLALKPPHLRTPEMMSLDSASDSDVIYIPNEPTVVTRVDSSTTDSEDNKPLAETKKLLKSEDDKKPFIQEIAEKKEEIACGSSKIYHPECIPSTSKAVSLPTLIPDDGSRIKKIYFAPKRKNISGKSIFESSTSSSSSDSNSSDTDDEWKTASNGKTKARRKLTAKKLKKIRLSSSSNTKPLSQLQTSEEAQHSGEENETNKPRIKSVIIKKTDNDHYIQKSKSSSESSSVSE